jgi:predicted GIY-YIG superfamily endonuclease
MTKITYGIAIDMIISMNLSNAEGVALLVYEFGEENTQKFTGYAISTIKNYYRKLNVNLILQYESVKKQFYEDCEKYFEKPCAYILSCYCDEYSQNAIKVGYTSDIMRRLNELEKNKKSKFSKYKILQVFNFDNCEDGYEMEIWLHRYCKKLGGTQIGQDHFLHLDENEIDVRFLNKKAKEIKINSKEWLDNIN